MAREYELEKIYSQIDCLRKEFEKMAHPNPYHIWIYNHSKKDNSNNKSKTSKSKVDSFSFNKYYIYPILWGVTFMIFAIAVFYFLYHKDEYTFTSFAVLLSGIFFPLLVYINTQGSFVGNLKSWRVLVLFCVAAGFMALGITNHNPLTKEILLIACLLSPAISYVFVFYPLSRNVFNVSIIEKLVKLQKELENLSEEKQIIFRNEIIESHSDILKKIETLKGDLEKGAEVSNDGLYKLMKLSVLEALKIELVQSSSRSLELTRNWQFVKLSQKMLDKIMEEDDTNKHITIVGDLSFLSHETGTRALFETVINREKTFDIYFVGTSKPHQDNIVQSEYFNKLVQSVGKIVTNYSENQKNTLWNSISFRLMPSTCFTGLGFIGLKMDKNTSDYCEIYSFVSSSLLPDKESKNIAEANPFVFSWHKETHYFSKNISDIEKRNKDAKPQLQLEYNGKSCANPMSFLKEYLHPN